MTASIRRERGFTLLEIMVAITIVTFIFGAVYTTFATISESDRSAGAAMEENMRVRNLSQYLTRDISSIFIPPENGGGEEQGPGLAYGLAGEGEEAGTARLDFTAVTTDTGRLRDARIVEVGYLLLASKEGGFRLVKRVDGTPDDDIREGGGSFELMDGIASLNFAFLKGDGSWEESWNSLDGRGSPVAVKVEVAFMDDETGDRRFSLQVPLHVGTEF